MKIFSGKENKGKTSAAPKDEASAQPPEPTIEERCDALVQTIAEESFAHPAGVPVWCASCRAASATVSLHSTEGLSEQRLAVHDEIRTVLGDNFAIDGYARRRALQVDAIGVAVRQSIERNRIGFHYHRVAYIPDARQINARDVSSALRGDEVCRW